MRLQGLIIAFLLIALPVHAQTVTGTQRGGTGASLLPSYGQILVGTATNIFSLMSTSSLGILGAFSTTSADYWGSTKNYLTGLAWGAITGTLSNQTDLQSALDAKITSAQLATYLTANSYLTSASHVVFTGTQPSISSCGSNPVVVGNDDVMNVTIGSGVVTTCTITFASTWALPANGVACTASQTSGTLVSIGLAAASSTLTLTSSATVGGDGINILCYGWQ